MSARVGRRPLSSGAAAAAGSATRRARCSRSAEPCARWRHRGRQRRQRRGPKSAQADFARIAGPLEVRSKHKCRVFWTRPGVSRRSRARAQWRALDAPRAIGDGRFLSRPGVFAWDRVDPASKLLPNLPAGLSRTRRRSRRGYGISLPNCCSAARASPRSTPTRPRRARARSCAREPGTVRIACRDRIPWHDVTAGLPGRYDAIVTNPPFHAQARVGRPDIGRAFIAAAAQALEPGGRLWLVANRHLPYESVLDARFGQVRIVAQREGFKVVEAVKARG